MEYDKSIGSEAYENTSEGVAVFIKQEPLMLEDHDSEEYKDSSKSVEVTSSISERLFDVGASETINKEECREDASYNEQVLGHIGEQYESVNAATHQFIIDSSENKSQEEFILPDKIDNIHTISKTLKEEPASYEKITETLKETSFEDPLAIVKVELEDETNEADFNEVSRNNIKVLDTSSAKKMHSWQLQIGSSQIEQAVLEVWKGEEIPKRVICRPYLCSKASKHNENEYGEELRINVPSYHVSTNVSGNRAVKGYRDYNSSPREGGSAQGKNKLIYKEIATSSLPAKSGESHRKGSCYTVEGAVVADPCTRNNNIGDKLLPEKPKCVSSSEATSMVRFERCKMGLLNSVKGEVLERAEGRMVREADGEGVSGTAPGKVMREETGKYECSYCGIVLSNKRNLVRHLAQHKMKKNYHCEVCDKQFLRENLLIMHAVIHTGEKPFKCSECSLCFTRFDTLNLHIRTHTGEKPYKCKECEAHFSHKSNLNAHMKSHTGHKPYKCNHCPAHFARKSSLNVHMRTHTGDKPYKCDTCCKAFSHRSSLKSHLGMHARVKPFQCLKCFKQFSNESCLNLHFNNLCTEGK